MTVLKNLLNFIPDLLFPKFCLGCKKEGFWICPDCFEKIKFFDSFSCPVCQKRLPAPLDSRHLTGQDGKICDSCKPKTKLSRFFAAFSYEDKLIREAVQKLKYNFIKELAKNLSLPIIKFLKNLNLDYSDFLIIPVPLHKSREKWRGFNQSEEIAKEISEHLKIPIKSNNLIRIKKTAPQVKLSDYQQREENVRGAFLVKKPETLKDKKIILIDDVYTSGSTIEECAKVLKRSGVKEIWGIVVAR